MSAGLHSKWNRTLTWMLSAALIAQGGTVVYAGDLGDEAAVEAFSEDNYEADDAASDLEFSGDEETVIEDSTDESTENIDAETSEGDEQTDADADFQSEADFTSEVQVEEETSIADGLYLGVDGYGLVKRTGTPFRVVSYFYLSGLARSDGLFGPFGLRAAARSGDPRDDKRAVTCVFDLKYGTCQSIGLSYRTEVID